MESEMVRSAGGGEMTSEANAGCEEVILPSMSMTNGGAEASDGAVEYLEEHDPMGDLNDIDELSQENNEMKKSKEQAEEVGDGDGDGEEPSEEVRTDEGEEYEALVEEDHEEGVEEDGEAVARMERKPTQVPKKRKDAVMLAATAGTEDEQEEEVDDEHAHDRKVGDGDDANMVKLDNESGPGGIAEDEQPTSTARAGVNKENVVEEEQCRVCTTKEDLVSLFKTFEQQTVADMLMTICPTVSIARKDFMPQYICNPCLDNVTIAMQLKTQCETTERELRKKLSRSKNKIRRPTGYVVIDAPVESDPPSEEEEPNDEEFKVSDEEVSASVDDDSEDSDFSEKKKRVVRGTGAKRGRRKSAVKTPTPKTKERKRMGRPPIKRQSAPEVNDSSDNEGEEQPKPKKKRSTNPKSAENTPTEFPCDQCEKVFTRKLSLVLHKKAHAGGRERINCKICGKEFKIYGAYRTHLEKHNEEDPVVFDCNKCDKIFPSKGELRRHMTEQHNDPVVLQQCNKCKRTFVSERRLERHKDGRCPGYETKQKKSEFDGYAMGKDLFKSVAPLTTTYWSDSFSD